MLPITLGRMKGDKETARTYHQINDSYREARESLNNAETKLRGDCHIDLNTRIVGIHHNLAVKSDWAKQDTNEFMQGVRK